MSSICVQLAPFRLCFANGFWTKTRTKTPNRPFYIRSKSLLFNGFSLSNPHASNSGKFCIMQLSCGKQPVARRERLPVKTIPLTASALPSNILSGIPKTNPRNTFSSCARDGHVVAGVMLWCYLNLPAKRRPPRRWCWWNCLLLKRLPHSRLTRSQPG